jgi:small-conductance mechanosensitive channel
MRRAGARFACALGLLLAGASGAHAQSPPAPAAPESSGPIPLSEVAARAAELRGLLDSQDAAFAPTREVQAILDTLPRQATELQARFEQTRARLEGNPPLSVVEEVGATWEATRAKLRNWNEALTQWAGRVEQERTRLAGLRDSWLRSREGAAAAGAPRVVLDQIDGIVGAINTTRARVETRLSTLLLAQYRLAQLQRRTDEALSRAAQARSDRLRRLGQREGPSLWDRAIWAGAVEQTPAAARDVMSAGQGLVAELGQQHAARVPLHVLLFLILLAVLWRGRRAASRWNADDPIIVTVVEVFNRPISSALVVSCVVAPWIYEEATPTLMRLIAVIAIVPVIRLIRPSLDRSVAPVLYVFGALFLLDAIRSVIASAPLFEHLVFLVEMLVASAGTLRVLRARRPEGLVVPEVDAMEGTALRLFGRLLLAAFASAFVVGSLGYAGLGRLIGAGALGSAYFGLAILAALQVAKGLVAVLLRSRPLGLLSSVQHARAALERRIVRVLRWIGALAWIAATLASLTLLPAVASAVRRALTGEWGWGAIRISLGDLAIFALTIWLSFVVAGAVRLLLAEDVFPRVRLAKGLPLAMSLVVQYALVLSGFTLALAALGVDLTKLTILAGAFGVGAGLGLQNLVNNFASGLILLFERPLHLGDVVQITGVGGEVRHIGARATLVRTADGAEVFIPNSQLVSQNFVNWTYSDLRRRIVLPVKVAHGATPRRVSELLVAIAAKHPLVLDQPAPAVVLMGFGESSLDFELRAWTDRFGDAETIQSELADAIYAGLAEARIDLPVPRRDVRLWRADEPPKGDSS